MAVVIYLFVCFLNESSCAQAAAFFRLTLHLELSLDDAVTFILLSEPSNDADAFKLEHLEG